MKSEIVAGDTLDFSTEVANYTPADGWTLKFRLVPRVSGTAILLTSAASDGLHRVQVGPTTTDDWAAGEYSWYSWVEKAGASYSVEQGQVTIKPDPRTTTAPLDNRSHARKVLEAIEAVIEGRASRDQQEYSIGDRTLKRTPMADLIMLQTRYSRLVAAEENEARLANGLGTKNVIRIRG
jgi:hypothetical protein